jgi:hypothetical protein
MSEIYKIVLSVLVCGCALFAGFYLYRFLNNKINESRTGWELLIYSVLLFAACAALFFGAIAVFVFAYEFLKDGGT